MKTSRIIFISLLFINSAAIILSILYALTGSLKEFSTAEQDEKALITALLCLSFFLAAETFIILKIRKLNRKKNNA